MIIRGQRLYEEPIECNGLLFIGDPHVSSRRPGRRTDADWPGPILRKLEACSQIARERHLMPIFTGDIFNSAVEPDEALKSRLIRVLKSFSMLPVTNTGNHDITNTQLSEGDSLEMLGASDAIDVVATGGPVCEFMIAGKRIGLGMTPYGQEIPKDVTGLFPDANVVVWVTHHDIAFDGAYPGAMQPFEIAGCRLVVNGHMHATKPQVIVGNTVWTNPGNINRQSIDLIDHIPNAWVMHGDGRFEAVPLPHVESVFDLTGKFVEAIAQQDMVREVDSAFVTLLQAETSTDMLASADGSLIGEEIEAKFKRDQTPDVVRAAVRSLLAEAVKRRSAA